MDIKIYHDSHWIESPFNHIIHERDVCTCGSGEFRKRIEFRSETKVFDKLCSRVTQVKLFDETFHSPTHY